MDPATGSSFGTPKTATTGTVTTTESGYSWLTISGATLGAGYSAGDVLMIKLTHVSVAEASVYYSALEINWN